jgi:hypothetical protein
VKEYREAINSVKNSTPIFLWYDMYSNEYDAYNNSIDAAVKFLFSRCLAKMW